MRADLAYRQAAGGRSGGLTPAATSFHVCELSTGAGDEMHSGRHTKGWAPAARPNAGFYDEHGDTTSGHYRFIYCVPGALSVALSWRQDDSDSGVCWHPSNIRGTIGCYGTRQVQCAGFD